MVLSRASSCSLWSGEVPVSMISLVLKRHVRPYQRRCRDVLLNGGSPSSGSTATMTTSSGWCVQGSGVWGGGVTGGGGAPAAQRLPMKAIQDHARFFLIAWREEVPKTLSSFQPPRYAIPSTAIEQRASPIVFAQHAIQAQSAAIVFAPLSFGSCNWKFNASIYCNPSRLPRS